MPRPVRAQAQAAPEAVEQEQAKHSAQGIREGMKKGDKKISKHDGHPWAAAPSSQVVGRRFTASWRSSRSGPALDCRMDRPAPPLAWPERRFFMGAVYTRLRGGGVAWSGEVQQGRDAGGRFPTSSVSFRVLQHEELPPYGTNHSSCPMRIYGPGALRDRLAAVRNS
jgi:hypothetical protein